ncbi:PREDICTED: asparagine--tRNA ligase, chloroplastic/mitochondrial-like [Lupinus angustifolius]|uniref:asparagine--tRNA ligase, chloroplastic/mitochondrial-like n=1 Tax=Lupinus angustifolius TaxID=3871 RepID=UPI00092EDF00|nr:PREDICTED: asparagine--tRNA ligase, chloroplastic/mitochondrial-like [Lupinus angustifolius]
MALDSLNIWCCRCNIYTNNHNALSAFHSQFIFTTLLFSLTLSHNSKPHHHSLYPSLSPPHHFFSSFLSSPPLLLLHRRNPSLRRATNSDKVGDFRKKLKVVDIKGSPSQGLDFLGNTLFLNGWVRTLRIQSSVTFIEINDGSSLSNMQCVIDSETEGYDQVESGLITTGASISVQGVIVESKGSKQKVELKVNKIILVGKSNPSFPIQKKRVSREFLRTKAHLRARTNTFGAVWFSFLHIHNLPVTCLLHYAKRNNSLICFNWNSSILLFFMTFFGKPAFLTIRYVLDKGIIDRLSDVADKDIVQITYTEAIDLLSRAKKNFEFPVKWGCDLQSEHECYITKEAFSGSPVIVKDYPKDIKAF